MADERARFPAGEEGWSEKGSSAPTDERPLVDAVPAAPDQGVEAGEPQSAGTTGESSGSEEGVAPPGDAPPFLPDTNESVVEEEEHGAAAEEALDAAAERMRTSRTEERPEERAWERGERE